LDGALLLLVVGLCDGLFDNAFLGDSVGDWLVGTICGCLVGLGEGGNVAVAGAFVNGKLVDGDEVVGSEVKIVGRCVGVACGCFGCVVLGFCIGVVIGLDVGSSVPVNVGNPVTGDNVFGFSVGKSIEGAWACGWPIGTECGCLVGTAVFFCGRWLGDVVSFCVGFCVGLDVGSSVRIIIGASVVGKLVEGASVVGCEVGRACGSLVGKSVEGKLVVGVSVGDSLVCTVCGFLVGTLVVVSCGLCNGYNVGSCVGFWIGLDVGSSVPVVVGASVFDCVVGSACGCLTGKAVTGASVGDRLVGGVGGCFVGTVVIDLCGLRAGDNDGSWKGFCIGLQVGASVVGNSVVGASVFGCTVGRICGWSDGKLAVGFSLGDKVNTPIGAATGDWDGMDDEGKLVEGEPVGGLDPSLVGWLVGAAFGIAIGDFIIGSFIGLWIGLAVGSLVIVVLGVPVRGASVGIAELSTVGPCDCGSCGCFVGSVVEGPCGVWVGREGMITVGVVVGDCDGNSVVGKRVEGGTVDEVGLLVGSTLGNCVGDSVINVVTGLWTGSTGVFEGGGKVVVGALVTDASVGSRLGSIWGCLDGIGSPGTGFSIVGSIERIALFVGDAVTVLRGIFVGIPVSILVGVWLIGDWDNNSTGRLDVGKSNIGVWICVGLGVENTTGAAVADGVVGTFTTTCWGLWVGVTVDMTTGVPIGKLVAGELVLGIVAGLNVKRGNDGLFVVGIGLPFNGKVVGTSIGIWIVGAATGTPVWLPRIGIDEPPSERIGGNEEPLAVVGNFVIGDTVGFSTIVGELSGAPDVDGGIVEIVGTLTMLGALVAVDGVWLAAGLLVEAALGWPLCSAGKAVGSIRANTSVDDMEGAVVSFIKPADEGPPFNEISSHAFNTFGLLKYSDLKLRAPISLKISEFATTFPAIPPPAIAATAATARAILVDTANPIEIPAALAATVAPLAADIPATFAAFIAKYCVIILLLYWEENRQAS
jgi:hypothetical protein